MSLIVVGHALRTHSHMLFKQLYKKPLKREAARFSLKG